MRRFLSISLLLALLFPVVSPLFAAMPDEANLPACCRRNGKHHCMMMVTPRPSSNRAPSLQPATIREKCPYSLTTQAPAHLNFTRDEPEAVTCASVISHPACHAQNETRLRISFDRSRQKRGPPPELL